MAPFVYLASSRRAGANSSPDRRAVPGTQRCGGRERIVGEPAEAYVARLAHPRPTAGLRARPSGEIAPVLAADTAVVLDGAILGKPADRADGERMLRGCPAAPMRC
jgi:hypothetical protein